MLAAVGDSKFLMILWEVQGVFHGSRELESHWILEWSSPHLSLSRGSMSDWAPEGTLIHCLGCITLGWPWRVWFIKWLLEKHLWQRQGKCNRSDVQSRTVSSLRVSSWSSLWSSCLWRTLIPAGSCTASQSNKVHMHLTNPSSAPFANQNKLFPCLPRF